MDEKVLSQALRTLESRDPGMRASVDQASAMIRDVLDDLGVDVWDEAQLRGVLGGITLFHYRTGQEHLTSFLALSLALARFLK